LVFGHLVFGIWPFGIGLFDVWSFDIFDDIWYILWSFGIHIAALVCCSKKIQGSAVTRCVGITRGDVKEQVCEKMLKVSMDPRLV
jgi:hypothetical protein